MKKATMKQMEKRLEELRSAFSVSDHPTFTVMNSSAPGWCLNGKLRGGCECAESG
jgi:hypothetical protein